MTENDEDRDDADLKKLKPATVEEWQFEQSELSRYLAKRRAEAATGKPPERE